jgi:hypothetical protein
LVFPSASSKVTIAVMNGLVDGSQAFVYASVKTRRSFFTTSSIDAGIRELVARGIAHDDHVGAARTYV